MERRDMGYEPETAADLLASPVRRAIIGHLTAGTLAPAPSAAELGAALGLHVTTARFHLDRLVGAGLVQSRTERNGRVGRPRKVYLLAERPDGPAKTAGALRLLAGLLTETLADPTSRNGTPEAAGRAWAATHVPAAGASTTDDARAWMATAVATVGVLRDWGYEPEVHSTPDGHTVAVLLHACPFAELARENPTVICGIHRGLIRGTLQQLGAASARVSLEPFVEPDLCIARLTTSTPFRDPAAPDTRRTA